MQTIYITLTSMKTQDEISKIKSALLYILSKFQSKETDFMKLYKILYFAQQSHLVRYGRPIVSENFRAMEFGPVPSFIYSSFWDRLNQRDCTDDKSNFANSFSFSTKKNIKYAKALIEPDMDELSLSDKEMLDKSFLLNANENSYDLSNKSHDNAWEEAFNRSKDDPQKDYISNIEIARSGNAKIEIINFIRENEKINRYFRS